MNVLLLAQLLLYMASIILSGCLMVTMSLHQDRFKGHCLLFSVGEWLETGQLNVTWASQAYCNYTIFVGVMLFLVSIIQTLRFSYYNSVGSDSSFLSAFIDVVASIFLSAFTVIGAIMITLGFKTWCDNITQRFPSCEIADGLDIDKKDGINTTGFNIILGTAQLAAWGSFAMWVGLTVLATVKLLRYHQIENVRVSMYRERQRLINEGGSPSGSLTRDDPAALTQTT